MSFTKLIEQGFRRFLPSPFTIAVLLSLFTIFLGMLFAEVPEDENALFFTLKLWERGIWNTGLLVFAYQMMLILVLGHVLVLSGPMKLLIEKITRFATNSANAAVLVLVPTLFIAFFNWGLGLIFGALLARKVGEHAQANKIAINYPLIGACGYAGLMVWHGGISGSAPLKVSEQGHLADLMTGYSNASILEQLPALISTAETVFNPSNLIIFLVVVLCCAFTARYLGKNTATAPTHLLIQTSRAENKKQTKGAERLDRSPILSSIFALLIMLAFLVQYLPFLKQLNLTPNLLNFFMLGLAIILHGNFHKFLAAVEQAISDVSGILIQFPLYFGIMGIMTGSGMISTISDFFVSVSNETTLPLFTFLSAGIVNIFVPSGGGQWAVQGPLVLESALALNVPLNKAVMALAYGDQLTNMLQPFWALPLLGITKLKANEILPYTVLFMFVGGSIYVIGLLLF